jgi:hypothetical protein
MKNNILDKDAIEAYAEALAILAEARHKVYWDRWETQGTLIAPFVPLGLHRDVESAPAPWRILLHASRHLRRKQKGFWLITQLRRGQDED